MPVDPPFQENTTNQSLRILVIEDNPVAADSPRQVLQLMGHTVEVAYTGTEGVQAAIRVPPDVVLCDIGLPEADGYSLAQLLRQQVNCKKIHVIGISGYAEDADRVRAARFEAYLTKPLDFAELGRMLEALQPDR